MPRLFAEAFLTPLLPDDGDAPEVRYDEARALNVLADGSPIIAIGHAGGTDTFTEVRNEADDADPEDSGRHLTLTTITKVKAERDDFARGARVGTSTVTRIRNEPDDEDRDARTRDGADSLATWTTTKSSVGTEPDDQDRDIATDEGFVPMTTITRTAVRAEADDVDHEIAASDGAARLGTVTHTFVRAEAEDEDRDSVRSLGPTTPASVKGEADDLWSDDDADGLRVGPARLVP